MGHNTNGAMIYRGPSMLDGSPIVAIVTGLRDVSENGKTGAMLQTFIIRSDVAPNVAIKSGADAAVCGDCKHRPALGGACYVNPRTAASVYRCLTVGSGYAHVADADAIAALGDGRAVRLGTYGDPAAVSVAVWQALVSRAALHTGYTHQWAHAHALRGLVMASADTPEEMAQARANGWRTFRVRLAHEALGPRESVCPASAEAGKKLNCATCGACNGADTGRKGSIAIVVHGALAMRFAGVRERLAA